MGPSGSGKSTILAVLAGLALPDRGTRRARRRGLARSRARRSTSRSTERRLSYVFQGLALFPHMTALQQRRVRHARRAARRARTPRRRALLERVGVGHLADRRPRTFSGGEAQRVALARALARSAAAGAARRAVLGARSRAARAAHHARPRAGRRARRAARPRHPLGRARRACSPIRSCGSSRARSSRGASRPTCSRT